MENKVKFIEAGFELIAENGYDKTSISMICDVVGIKKPTFYHYFKSKEGLYVSIIESFLSGEQATIFNKESSKDNYISNLKQYGLEFIKMYSDNSLVSSFIMDLYTQSTRQEFLVEIMGNYHKQFKNELKLIVLKGNELGFILDEHVELYSEKFYSIIHGIEFSLFFGTELNQELIWIDFVESIIDVEGQK